ncbi:TonB-dependent receptor [Bizionia myxarmorum]|uniref:TonB-dependent receptor n=1 Tax=Bizionia myxarmorum TaxID=291186 RepID=A0A5D0R622_9FLAO|nr:TonB-dependent receptor [Bizionia myxarmorum]TYB76873.1 TonB-dependent receptor [Bizionia myxarmorum]
MRKHFYIIFASLFTLSSIASFAQVRDKDTLDTNVINVVKPYTPSISDAFKVKETPSLDDDVTATKKPIEYNIFSIPVASTFTPAKGKAAVLDKQKPPKFYNNYASLGFGSYTTILGELYLNHAISRNETVGGYIRHESSQGGIDKLLLDDAFFDTKLQATYGQTNRDMSWNVNFGGLHQIYNWYGMQQPLFTEADAVGVDAVHSFYGVHLGGDFTFQDSYIDTGSVLFRHFGDDYGSGENNFKAKIASDIPVSDFEINTELTIEYVGGSFDRNYITTDAVDYGNFSIGLAPTYQLIQDDLTLDLGVSLVYLNNTEAGDSNFFIYPNISASYRVVDELVIAYGGIKGGLIQNTYYSFAQDNPFVSPTLGITPTDQKYHAFVGLKGKVSNSVGYNIKGAYMAENNKGLFRNNLVPYDFALNESYQFGNSYGVVYDNVTTITAGGELNVDLNRNFTLGLSADYFIYDTKYEAEAWNLPSIKASLFMDYQISEKWFAGASLFYEGERESLSGFAVVNNPLFPTLVNPTQKVTLDGFFDANAHVGYHVNDRLSVFAKVNNIASQNYQRWSNYPVQSFQAIAGASYKFDF